MANQFGSTSLNATIGILKNFYGPGIISQFNDEIPFYKNCENGREKYTGLQVVRALKVLRNPGIGATSDGGPLPSIGTQTTVQAQIAARFNYLRFGITGPMIKASANDKGAFANDFEYEMKEGMTDLKNDVNRQLFWTGRGDLAVIAANVVASSVITTTGRVTSENGDKYLFPTMVVDIVSTGGVYKAKSVTISSVTTSGPTATLVLSSPVTCAQGDIVVRENAFNLEIQGLGVALDSGSNNLSGTSTIYNVSRATYPVYQGNVFAAGNAQLTLNFLKQAWNSGKQRGGAKYDYCVTDYTSEAMYEKLLILDKRYIGKVKGDGTFSNKDENYLDYGGIPLVSDKDCPGSFFFIDSKQWKKYILAELEWADETGSYMIAQVGADAFECRLRLFMNLFPEKPSAQVAVNGYISP